jgi:hypothetical protein
MKTDKDFPNGLTSWIQTHHEIVVMITLVLHKDDRNNPLVSEYEARGTGGMYELAEDLTNKFEELHKDREWDGEFFEEIEFFFDQEIKKL